MYSVKRCLKRIVVSCVVPYGGFMQPRISLDMRVIYWHVAMHNMTLTDRSVDKKVRWLLIQTILLGVQTGHCIAPFRQIQMTLRTYCQCPKIDKIAKICPPLCHRPEWHLTSINTKHTALLVSLMTFLKKFLKLEKISPQSGLQLGKDHDLWSWSPRSPLVILIF